MSLLSYNGGFLFHTRLVLYVWWCCPGQVWQGFRLKGQLFNAQIKSGRGQFHPARFFKLCNYWYSILLYLIMGWCYLVFPHRPQDKHTTRIEEDEYLSFGAKDSGVDRKLHIPFQTISGQWRINKNPKIASRAKTSIPATHFFSSVPLSTAEIQTHDLRTKRFLEVEHLEFNPRPIQELDHFMLLFYDQKYLSSQRIDCMCF